MSSSALHPALQSLAGPGLPLDLPLDALRAAVLETGLRTAGEPPAGVQEETLQIPLRGAQLDAWVYRAAAAGAAGGVPLVAYFHGGGWATGSPEGFAAIARNLAVATGGVVVSVDYRLAPEHRFPVPVNDCLGATRWLQENAQALGARAAEGEEAPAFLLAGDSAGAHLALSVALVLRDAGRDADGVVAFYPCLDPSCATPSWQRLGEGHYLTRERMRWYWHALLGDALDRPTASMTPWANPDLAGLPPVFVAVAGLDPLRDEGLAFARDLDEAGVEVRTLDVPGMLHGFLRWRTLVGAQADDTVRAACDWVLGRDLSA